MRVNLHTAGNIRVVEIFEDLVAEETEPLRNYLEDQINDGCVRLVLDFSRVDYMCSFALGAMVTILKKVRDRGGDLKLAQVNSWLKNLLKIAQIAKIMDIYDTVPEAVKAFSALPLPADDGF